MSNLQKLSIFRLPTVVQLVGLSRSTIYLLIQKNKFPKPVLLSERAVGWKQSEIEAWLLSRTKREVV